jgi:hypothetical protein
MLERCRAHFHYKPSAGDEPPPELTRVAATIKAADCFVVVTPESVKHHRFVLRHRFIASSPFPQHPRGLKHATWSYADFTARADGYHQ